MARQTFNGTKINVEFEESASRQQLNSGENISTLFGKIKKIFSDLKSVCFSGSYKDLNDTPSTVTSETDGLMSASDKAKLDGADDTYALKSLYGDTTINVGRKAGTKVGYHSTAEGVDTTASGLYAHSEGHNTVSSGDYGSHSEGENTGAIGACSHAEGNGSKANGDLSHAEGSATKANGRYSHAEGHYTIANNEAESACGKFNISNPNTLFSVGDGTADDARHNAFEITATGGKLHDKDIATTDDISNPNLLINPDFKINQREKSGTIIPDKNANGGDIHTYFVDRWGIDSGSVTINTDGTLTLNGTMSQILENPVGTNVTASVSAGTATYDDTTKTFTITGNAVTVSWAKLETGSAATPFIPPDPATELMKCQRYYQVIDPGSPAFGVVRNSSQLRMTYNIICPMRTNPTLTLLHHTGDFTWSFIVRNAAGTSFSTTNDFSEISASLVRAVGTIINVYINVSHTLSTGEIVYVSGNGGIYFLLDAEIY